MSSASKQIELSAPDCYIPRPQQPPKAFAFPWPEDVTHLRPWYDRDLSDIEVCASIEVLQPYIDVDIWLELTLASGCKFWYNSVLKKSYWCRPLSLMPLAAVGTQWREYTEKGGRVVWYHSDHGKTSINPFANADRRARQKSRRVEGLYGRGRALLKVADVTEDMFVKSLEKALLPSKFDVHLIAKHFPELHKTAFLPTPSLDREAFELLVFSGLDPFLSPVTCYADVRANILYALLESLATYPKNNIEDPDEEEAFIGVSPMSKALFLAWFEPSHTQSTSCRRAYVDYLWEALIQVGKDGENQGHLELPYILTPKQRRTFHNFTKEIAFAIGKMRRDGQDMAYVDDILLKLFPTNGLNDHLPLRLPKARGEDRTNHPSQYFSGARFDLITKGLLGSLKQDETSDPPSDMGQNSLDELDLMEMTVDDYQIQDRETDNTNHVIGSLDDLWAAMRAMRHMELDSPSRYEEHGKEYVESSATVNESDNEDS